MGVGLNISFLWKISGTQSLCRPNRNSYGRHVNTIYGRWLKVRRRWVGLHWKKCPYKVVQKCVSWLKAI